MRDRTFHIARPGARATAAIVTWERPCLATFWLMRSSTAVDRIERSIHSSRDGKPLCPMSALPGEKPLFLYAITRQEYEDCMDEHHVRHDLGVYIPF